MKSNKEKVKTTVMIEKTLKKFAQVYAVQNETTLSDVIESALREFLSK